MKQTIYLLLLLTCFGFYQMPAQGIDIGVTGSVGTSYVSENYGETAPGVSYNAGFVFQKMISKKITLGTEINIARFIWKEERLYEPFFNIRILPGNSYSGVKIYSEYKKQELYVALPVFARIEIKKMAVKAGMQILLLNYAYFNVKKGIENNGKKTIDEEEYGEYGLKSIALNYGPKIGFEYKVGNNLWLRGDYYYSLSRAVIGRYSTSNHTARQLVFGINYYLSKTTN
ncbi:MAG TPA: PorT family protein [Bacteroidetes bacterium]|nr:PorT family protein [Bacteroidota bacterium]